MIGLVRHFKVNLDTGNRLYTPNEFNIAMDQYDIAPVIIKPFDSKNIVWNKCYCSDLPRAITTAKTIFPNSDIEITPLLREVPLRAFTKKRIKLPALFWHIGARIAWHHNKPSQPESRIQTEKRIRDFLEILGNRDSKENILIVTHGFFMINFHRYLSKIGYAGKIDPRPRNGILYLIKKPE